MPPALAAPSSLRCIPTAELRPSAFSLSVYGDPEVETDGLLDSVRAQGVLVPLVVVREAAAWEVLSGHRRLACARLLGLPEVPCQERPVPRGAARRRAVLEYNRQRRKSFSQLMREADAQESLLAPEARRR
ncbi:MAG TPA: ParB/RepB/Spo0J family partition protein, partial [Isosphaeraceae bacterium]